MTAGEKYGPTASGLEAALIALGSTPDAVATTLANGGYRGKRCNGSQCPVAAYLTAMIDGRETYVDSEETGLLMGKTPAGDLNWMWIETPAAVGDFVVALDEGMWPELAVES